MRYDLIPVELSDIDDIHEQLGPEASAADELRLVMDTWQLSGDDIACVLDVSRSTVWSWLVSTEASHRRRMRSAWMLALWYHLMHPEERLYRCVGAPRPRSTTPEDA